jgi:hypothetical protein
LCHHRRRFEHHHHRYKVRALPTRGREKRGELMCLCAHVFVCDAVTSTPSSVPHTSRNTSSVGVLPANTAGCTPTPANQATTVESSKIAVATLVNTRSSERTAGATNTYDAKRFQEQTNRMPAVYTVSPDSSPQQVAQVPHPSKLAPPRMHQAATSTAHTQLADNARCMSKLPVCRRTVVVASDDWLGADTQLQVRPPGRAITHVDIAHLIYTDQCRRLQVAKQPTAHYVNLLSLIID